MLGVLQAADDSGVLVVRQELLFVYVLEPVSEGADSKAGDGLRWLAELRGVLEGVPEVAGDDRARQVVLRAAVCGGVPGEHDPEHAGQEQAGVGERAGQVRVQGGVQRVPDGQPGVPAEGAGLERDLQEHAHQVNGSSMVLYHIKNLGSILVFSLRLASESAFFTYSRMDVQAYCRIIDAITLSRMMSQKLKISTSVTRK